MSNLPTGWVMASLSEICGRIVDGSHVPPKPVSSGLPMLSAKNIQNRQLMFDEYRLIDEKEFAREHARTNISGGDVLLTIVGAIGRTVVVPVGTRPFTLQRSVAVLKPKLADSHFVSYALESPTLQKYLSDNAKGTAQKGIYLQALSQVEIPLAPLNEQKRIAEKLNSLLARVDSCQSHLERVPQILKRFRQSVLDAATSGRLTEKQYGSNNAHHRSLRDVIERIKTGPFGSALHKSDYVSGGIPLVNPMHINNGKITPSEDMTISKKKAHELREFLLSSGDVILARRGVMGRCAVVRGRENGWLCGSGSMFLRPNKDILPDYLQIFLSSPSTVAILNEDSVGSTMSNLNQKILFNLQIRVPRIEEQHEIVSHVERLFAFADKLEVRYETSSDMVEQLTPSLLAKAFRGELIKQDPNDEDAKSLLMRIQTSQERNKIEIEKIKPSRKDVEQTRYEVSMFKRSDIEQNYLSSILKDRGALTAESLWNLSKLEIDEFYEQLKQEEAKGFLREILGDDENTPRLLEAL